MRDRIPNLKKEDKKKKLYKKKDKNGNTALAERQRFTFRQLHSIFITGHVPWSKVLIRSTPRKSKVCDHVIFMEKAIRLSLKSVLVSFYQIPPKKSLSPLSIQHPSNIQHVG